ncbi:CAP domain-containing protein [Leptothoe sp. PORK10 BA2]|uniref:CAP domain-containing protein n=1 Tax=Leptothoe sp. PORK10 BA2 TaxID=3110254 RepID=UPI002B1FDB7C|nr:CAP domain-containing protein [Leptothoe sp. PORK10 BA2]MEA5465683.1 CAP domain-containing protein [Leptothoe sp. PORK10 BA2]
MGFRSLASILLIGVMLTGCGGGGGGGSNSNDSTPKTTAPKATPVAVSTPSCNTELEAIFNDLLAVTNQVRVDHGVSTLRFSRKLGQMAQGHAEDMANRDYFAHTSPDGLSTVASRIRATNYRFSSAAENIAAGYNSAEDVVADWLNSPGHRVNLLNPNYVDVGFGLFFDPAPGANGSSNFDSYWVQDFGRPTDSNTDIEAAYSPSNCSIGDIASSDTAVLSGAITADVSANALALGDGKIGEKIQGAITADISADALAVGDGEIGKKIQTAYALGKVEAELVAVEISATQAVLSAHLSNEPMSTPEPAMALGLLTAALGIIFPRREN